jgi:aldehyde dehydrogenase (NAD(P)+)
VLVREGDPALQTEAFCDVLAVSTLPGELESYLASAVAFANDRLDGTLGANLIVHPKTERAFAAEVDGAIAALRYGCIAVNAWTGVGYLLAETPWGAYPGHTPDDVGSGIGVVHNAHLFSRSLKSVVRAPFAPFPRSLGGYGSTLLPKPPWFVTNAMAARIGEALCAFEARPSPGKAAHIAALAMRG